MTLDDLSAVDLDLLADDLARLRHDLGKYVGFETRFVGLDASTDDLRTALKADLLATRRRGAESTAAWELWAELRPARIADDPDVIAIDRAIDALARVDLDGPDPVLRRAAELAAEVTRATRRLSDRARARR